MTQKSPAYDNPAYQARLFHAFGQNAAGASTNFGKFVAFTNMTVFAIQASNITASTSTQTTWNGTGTVVQINADQFYLIHVLAPGNITVTGGTTTLGTTTHGPFGLSTGTATITAVAGASTRVQLSGTGTSGSQQGGASAADGGVPVYPGDTLHILRGTDATAVSAFAIELALQPTANLTT